MLIKISVLVHREKKELVFFGQHAADHVLLPDDPVPLKIDDLRQAQMTFGNADIGQVMKQVKCFFIVDRSDVLRVLLPYFLTTSVHNDPLRPAKPYALPNKHFFYGFWEL